MFRDCETAKRIEIIKDRFTESIRAAGRRERSESLPADQRFICRGAFIRGRRLAQDASS